jgi:alpha-N-arabinofuranosidase
VRAQSSIAVNATTAIDIVNPLLFGNNVLFSNGMWDTRTNALHAGAAPLINGLSPWSLRFPGGSTADQYIWEDALGLKTTVTVSAGTSSITLEGPPPWGTVTAGRFIDAGEGQFGDAFTFSGIGGTQVQGVSGVGVSHAAGAEVRPDFRQGQPSWFMHQYGIDEHMKLVTSLGAEAVITVNYGSGLDALGAVSSAASLSQRVKRAAAWVAYLNGDPADTRPLGIDGEGTDWQTVGYWAQRRVTRGQAAPYNVRYWEVGNEVYGSWETGYTTARQYAADFVVFAAAMKSVDPSIEVGAVGLADPHGRGDADTVDEWNATVVSDAGNGLDFLALHPYYPSASRAQAQGSYSSTTWFTAVMAAARQVTTDFEEIRRVIAASSARATEIDLAVTEYGIWPAESTSANDYSNLGRALHDADLLMAFLRQGTQLGLSLATAWNLHGNNQTAAIRYDWNSGNRVARPQYYAYQLLGDLAPQLHATTVSAPTFSTVQVGNVAAASGIPSLAAVAGSDGVGGLTLLVLNRSLSSNLRTSISLAGFTPQSTATVRTLNAKNLAAHNESKSSTVVIKNSTISSVAATFTYTFPAHSLTLIEFLTN